MDVKNEENQKQRSQEYKSMEKKRDLIGLTGRHK
jgi:hypothetical protein